MKLLVTGSGGLVGSALLPVLRAAGHTVVRLIQNKPAENEIEWEGLEAVIHLAGESIAANRWTAEIKKKIRDSRVLGTRFLCRTLAGLKNPPRVLISASAVGYYGDRGNELLTEESPAGRGFLSQVCQEWEEAAKPAAEKGIRVVPLRFGMILSAEGGGLAKMLPPFRMGLGGRLGSGTQGMSWVSLEDVIGITQHVLKNESLKGPVNAVAPQTVTNNEFTKTLGRVLSRPTPFPVPAAAVKLVFGEMADELLLASTRVIPKKLTDSGYLFKHPLLYQALSNALKGKAG